MAQINVLKRYLEAGMSFTAMTQSKAEELVRDLVKAGEVQTEQAQALVTELVDRSRKNTEALLDQVRQEISASAESLGLATLADLARVETLVESLRAGADAARTAGRATIAKGAKKPPAKKAPAKEATAAASAPAKKTTAKKAATKKAAARKVAATKAVAKKSAAKKSAGKSAAKKAPAKKAAAKKTAAKKTAG